MGSLGNFKKLTGIAAVALVAGALLLVSCGGNAPATTTPAKTTAAATTAAPGKVYNARLATHWPTSHIGYQALDQFTKDVDKASNGQIKITIYPSGQLFGNTEIMPALMTGSIELGATTIDTPGVPPNMTLGKLYFFWDSFKQERDFVLRSDTGKKLQEEFTQKTGTKMLGMLNAGYGIIAAKSKINAIKDLSGQKARGVGGVEGPIYEGFGLVGVALNANDVYSALQTNMITVTGATWTSMFANNWDQFLVATVGHHAYLSEHFFAANQTWFNSLPKNLQDILMQQGQATQARLEGKVDEETVGLVKKWTDAGKQIYELTPAEKTWLDQLLSEKAWPANFKEMDKSVVQAALDFTGKKVALK